MNEILQFHHTDENSFVNRPPPSQPFFASSRNTPLERYVTTQRTAVEQTTIFSAHKNIEFRIFLEPEVKRYG